MQQPVTLFISDLHLDSNEPHITQIFLRFLKNEAVSSQKLYILGDLFEAWIGDDDLGAFNLQIIQALKAATATGLPIYFMRGNRDFLIGQRFAAMSGVQLLEDPTVIDLYGQRVLLTHGDSLCTFDRLHQFWRRISLHPLFAKIALYLPLSWRRQIGAWLRRKSHQHQYKLPESSLDICQKTALSQMQIYQASQLIHGHTHRPGIHQHRTVLGAWHETGSVLICNQHDYQLQTLF